MSRCLRQPPRDERWAAELLKRLLDARLSPFEPDPVAVCEAAEAEAKRPTPPK
ncbi:MULTISPECIES: hypothetical protein [unclassified Bradyrhizobium]|uniref:hypothetical protein n=1 Tax=unclassified Bradyrhizobium TaxID=2631580 RepID=UPI001BD0CCBF|nr:MULTISPECIES: hypothetical protein [unclassified Bradyrhizobium]WOH52242.1 hypothetical protein RX328_08380 [Bradyrhizobium sp. sBnM-33]